MDPFFIKIFIISIFTYNSKWSEVIILEIKFKELTFEVFSHSTENKDKVIQSIKNLIPNNLNDLLIINEEKLEGHFHNPIIKIIAILKGNNEVKEILQKIIEDLDSIDRENLKNNLKSIIDESGFLYLRLNKQFAFNKKISLKTEVGDILRLKLKILKKGPEKIEDIIKKYIEFFK